MTRKRNKNKDEDNSYEETNNFYYNIQRKAIPKS